MGSWGNQPESGLLQAIGEGLNVVDSEFDLDFAIGSHSASIKKVAGAKTLDRKTHPVVPKNRAFYEKQIIYYQVIENKLLIIKIIGNVHTTGFRRQASKAGYNS